MKIVFLVIFLVIIPGHLCVLCPIIIVGSLLLLCLISWIFIVPGIASISWLHMMSLALPPRGVDRPMGELETLENTLS